MKWVRVETTSNDRRIYFMPKEVFEELGHFGADPADFDEDAFSEILPGDEEILLAEEVEESDLPPPYRRIRR